MKNLFLLMSLVLVGCKGAESTSALSNPTTTTNNSPAATYWTQNRVDTNVQSITYNNLNSSSTYYTSDNTLADNDIITIPEYINIDTDSNNSIQSNDKIELQIANRTKCYYNKVTNYFQFDYCETVLSSITWTIQAGDVYRMSDLNDGAPLAYKSDFDFVLRSTDNLNFTGTIEFSYDL